MDDPPDGGMQQEDEAAAVSAFLRANPGFLAADPSLYAALDPPRRVHGVAVADHMDAMLRRARLRAEELERDAAGVAADRRASEGFTRRVHHAVLALMRSAEPALTAAQELPQLLQVDAARICAEGAWAPPGAAVVPRGTVLATLGQRMALVRPAQPDALLHGEAVALAEKEALVRVPLTDGPALLALACRDGQGLAGATTDALAFMGQALATAIELTAERA